MLFVSSLTKLRLLSISWIISIYSNYGQISDLTPFAYNNAPVIILPNANEVPSENNKQIVFQFSVSAGYVHSTVLPRDHFYYMLLLSLPKTNSYLAYKRNS